MKKGKLLFLSVISLTLACSINALAQSIPNNSFETWSNGKNPDSWKNEYGQPDSTILKQTTGARDGNFAMKVRVHHVAGVNTDEYSYVTSRFSYSGTAAPVKLTYYSLVNVVTGDSCRFTVNLFKSGVQIGSGIKRYGTQVVPATWVFQEIPITYTTSSIVPDSAEIIIIAGDADNGAQKDGTYLILDKVEFDGVDTPMGIASEESSKAAVSVYPNPASSAVTFSTGNLAGAEIKLYDSLGALVKVASVNRGESATLATADLDNGIYFYSVTTGSKAVGSGMLVINK